MVEPGANRSTTAPYSVNGGSGIPKNQQTGGGTWNSLGTFSLAAGSNNVRLSCWAAAGYVVVADAVRVFGDSAIVRGMWVRWGGFSVVTFPPPETVMGGPLPSWGEPPRCL